MRWVLLLWLACGMVRAAEEQFVVLVTGDGIRHQEVFTGVGEEFLDPAQKKLSGIESLEKIRAEFWAEDARARRERLMPFFWKELAARHGVVFGNRELGSKAGLRNTHHFSYPGYAEILNGRPLPEIASNDRVWSPSRTILEFIREEFNLPARKVAAFGSWDVFNWICMSREEAVFCNAGYEAFTGGSAEAQRWSDLQFQFLSPWDTVRHDAVTLNLALNYLEMEKPRFLYLALGETDDWAHERRYDRYVQTLRYFDDALRLLWNRLQATTPYAGRTTLIITTDHGRGRMLEDWTSHSNKVPGADETWVAVFGPGVSARGEARGGKAVSLSNVAATVVKVYGLDLARFSGEAAEALPVFK